MNLHVAMQTPHIYVLRCSALIPLDSRYRPGNVFNGRLIPGIIIIFIGPRFCIVGSSCCRHLAKELKLDSAGKSTGSERPKKPAKGQNTPKASRTKNDKKGRSKRGKGTPSKGNKRAKKAEPASSAAAESATVPKKARRTKKA